MSLRVFGQLRVRLLVLVGIATLPALAFVLYSASHQRSAARRQIEHSDGVRRLFAFAPLAGSEGVFVTVGIETERAFAPAEQALLVNLVGLGFITFFAAAAGLFGAEIFVLRGIRGLARATRQLATGDLSARVAEEPRQGEIGELARAFNVMASALEQATRRSRRPRLGSRPASRLCGRSPRGSRRRGRRRARASPATFTTSSARRSPRSSSISPGSPAGCPASRVTPSSRRARATSSPGSTRRCRSCAASPRSSGRECSTAWAWAPRSPGKPASSRPAPGCRACSTPR